MATRELELAAGAVLVPRVSSARNSSGDFSAGNDVRPTRAYLERFPPAGVVILGRGAEAAQAPDALLEAVRAELARAGAPEPFAAWDLELGAGLLSSRSTRFPPAQALAAAAANAPHGAAGLALVRSAGAITALEARAHGVDLVLAPAADANSSFGDDPRRAAELAQAFHEGLALGGAGGAARQVAPYRAPVQDAADTLLGDALDASSREHGARPNARALAAGCDGLLCPRDPDAAADEILSAVAEGELDEARLLAAGARMLALRERLRKPWDEALLARALEQGRVVPAAAADGTAAARQAFALDCAVRALRVSTTRWAWKPGQPCEVLAPLHQARGLEARALINGLRTSLATSTRPRGVLLPVVLEAAAGADGLALDASALEEIDGKVAALRKLGWPVGILWLGSPRSLPKAWWQRHEVPVLLAHAATPPLVEAVRRFLEGRVEPGGFLTTPPG